VKPEEVARQEIKQLSTAGGTADGGSVLLGIVSAARRAFRLSGNGA
jgi:hypothetical protein